MCDTMSIFAAYKETGIRTRKPGSGQGNRDQDKETGIRTRKPGSGQGNRDQDKETGIRR